MQPRNPYLDVSSDTLAKACGKAAEDLAITGPRTREQRLELADRVRLVLLAAGKRIAPSGSWFSRPEAGRDPQDFLQSLRADHEQRSRELRYRALVMAAEHALGESARSWLRDARRGGARVYDLALASEEGLEAALADLARATRAAGSASSAK